MNKFEKDFTALKQTVDQYKQKLIDKDNYIEALNKLTEIQQNLLQELNGLLELKDNTISGQAEEIDELKDELNDIFLKEKGIEKS